MSHVSTDPAVVVDPNAAEPMKAETIWYKGQRVVRTILVALVVIVPTANGLLPLVADAFNRPDVPANVYLWVNGVIAAVLVVVGILTRLIAIPRINAWLTKLGAGSVPKAAIK